MNKLITICFLIALPIANQAMTREEAEILVQKEDSKAAEREKRVKALEKAEAEHKARIQAEKELLNEARRMLNRPEKEEHQEPTSCFPDVKTIPLSLCTSNTMWTRSSTSTNNVVVSVIVGAYKLDSNAMDPYVRDLTFDSEGKLVSVSEARIGTSEEYAYLAAPTIKECSQSSQCIPAHGK